MKTHAMLVVLVLVALGAALPAASAGTSYCEEKTNSTGAGKGTWTQDCTGVDASGCVGKWGSSGTYETTSTGSTYHTDSWYRSVVCPNAQANVEAGSGAVSA